MGWLCCRVAKGGEGSLETAAAQQVRGAILRAIGGPRLMEAEAAYAACLASREQALGQQHPDTAIAMLGATPYCSMIGRQALLHQTTSHISASGTTSSCLIPLLFRDVRQVRLEVRCAGLGETNALMGNTGEAQPMLQRAHSLLLRSLGASHPYADRARQALQACI